MLPVIMVTALDANEERVKGLEAGADDFLVKPINSAELLARVRSLLRVKCFHDTMQAQAAELATLNAGDWRSACRISSWNCSGSPS